MIPLRIEGATHIMAAPPGRPEVRDLHTRLVDGCYVSRWEPTPIELQMLNQGGPVELWVMGGMPPVNIQVARKVDRDGCG
jgi:hypothetical protein